MLAGKQARLADKASKVPFYKRRNFQLYLFVSVAVALPFIAYLVFVLYPNVLSIYYSFLRWDGLGEKVFIGFDNYKRLFQDPEVYKALWHNLILLVVTVPLTLFISLILADTLTSTKFKENKVLKVIYFLPNVFSVIVISLIWMFVYDGTFGMLNSVIRLFGGAGNTNWLGNPKTALACIVPISLWSGVGFYTVIFSNAMRGVPKSLYDAAAIDGVSHLQRFWKITLPMIGDTIAVAVLFLSLSCIRGYETIMVMTKGGPAGATSVIGLYMYNYAFGTGGGGIKNYGYASAVGLFIAVLLIIVKFVSDRITARNRTVDL